MRTLILRAIALGGLLLFGPQCTQLHGCNPLAPNGSTVGATDNRGTTPQEKLAAIFSIKGGDTP